MRVIFKVILGLFIIISSTTLPRPLDLIQGLLGIIYILAALVRNLESHNPQGEKE